MSRDVIGLRASAELRALIESYGNLSAASQALMLIGAAALGADLSDLRPDLLRLYLSERISPSVARQLWEMLNTPLTVCLTKSGPAPGQPELLEFDDPFAVGIEV